MDIPALLATYGGPGGFMALLSALYITDRKFSAERHKELREDIDREREDNTQLRTDLREARSRVTHLEGELRKCRHGEEDL